MTMNLNKEILIIVTGHAKPDMVTKGLDFSDRFVKLMGAKAVKIVDVLKGEKLPRVSEVDRIVITGSVCMVTDREAWMLDTEAWLREARQERIPMLGVCFGHQLLGSAFGGVVGDNPKGTEVGSDAITLTDEGQRDPLFKPLGKQFGGYVSHTQSVLELPPAAKRLGYSSHEANHIFKLDDNIYGVQFHPEFNEAIIEDSISRATDVKQVKRLTEAQIESLDYGLESGEMLLKAFLAVN